MGGMLNARAWLALTICLVGTSASGAAPLQGHWQVTMPHDPGFSGELVVDGQRRVLFTGTSPRLGGETSRGYISSVVGPRTEIVLTDGNNVGHIRCVAQSADSL